MYLAGVVQVTPDEVTNSRVFGELEQTNPTVGLSLVSESKEVGVDVEPVNTLEILLNRREVHEIA